MCGQNLVGIFSNRNTVHLDNNLLYCPVENDVIYAKPFVVSKVVYVSGGISTVFLVSKKSFSRSLVSFEVCVNLEWVCIIFGHIANTTYIFKSKQNLERKSKRNIFVWCNCTWFICIFSCLLWIHTQSFVWPFYAFCIC